MRIHAFPALRPASNDVAQKIASLPYDVMDTAEAKEMAKGNDLCFLHVVRSEIDLPDGADPHSDAVYAKARAALDKLQSDGDLVREASPALYIYRQTMNGRSQTSIVACCEIDDYATGIILKHEKTRKDKEDDRVRHIITTNANTGQVFLAYRGKPQIDALVAGECARRPMFDFVSDDGVGHAVWRVEKAAEIARAFEGVEKAYIADGHHRSAASYRAGMERRNAAATPAPDAEYNRFMACLFPAGQLAILPYNRCVRDLNGLTEERFLAKVAERFEMADAAAPDLPEQCTCAMYIGGKWRILKWRPVASGNPVDRLDVSKLQNDLLAPILGIRDPRLDQRIFFVGGIRGNGELVKNVDSGEAAVAFAMRPTTMDQLMDIADASELMPPKSTWFEPKLRSGLLIHTLD